jgi:hypothetical protein
MPGKRAKRPRAEEPRSVECPSCGTINTPRAERCACGWNLQNRDHTADERIRKARTGRAAFKKFAGVTLILGGLYFGVDGWRGRDLEGAVAGLGFGNGTRSTPGPSALPPEIRIAAGVFFLVIGVVFIAGGPAARRS